VPEGYASTGVTFGGVASWYGPGFAGNLTANGEIYDPMGLTAANKELPFNTLLFVKYNGRGVVVRINDRGPYAGDRIIDLSQGAAETVGMSGIGWVDATIVVKK
jgi:rare lipoprotein A